jgi:hypothetical protein
VAENNGQLIINIYSPVGLALSSTDDIDNVIKKFNRIIEQNNTQIEKSLLKVLEILSIMDESTQLHIRFLLFTIALESLLLGGETNNLRKKFAEKITFLIGFKNALKFFNLEEIRDNSNTIDNVNVILKFERKIKSFYDKRSRIAHAGNNDDINTKDVEDISSILILIIIKLFDLIENEKITHIIKTDTNDESSLDYYLSKLNYESISKLS